MVARDIVNILERDRNPLSPKITEMTDEDLLKIYMWGFEDELTGETRLIPQELLATKAYTLGKIDALVGDDVSSVDLQTDEEILNRIKMKKKFDAL